MLILAGKSFGVARLGDDGSFETCCVSHACCWMAWAVHREWGRARNRVKSELSEVVHTIARYEPVFLLAPRGGGLREAQREFSACSSVTVIEAPVDDIWMRDIAPTFALRSNARQQEIVAIDWNFNGWGGTTERPPRADDRLASTAASIFGVPRLSMSFFAEGGALITDGRGTLITTRSCLLNPNRNPVRHGEDRQRRIEIELEKLGIRRVIWLEGDPCEPGTSGHVDGYVLLAPSGVVLVEFRVDEVVEQPMWRAHDINVLENAKDMRGRNLKVERVPVLGYLNAYVANGAVITARFGNTERDEAARKALATTFTEREIIMLRIDNIANGGSGVHCLTQPFWDTSKEVEQ